jgi:hypothetical protein
VITILAIYVRTLDDGCVGGDAGELMAMTCSGGIPHPPGYPLLMIAGRLWMRACPVQIGSPALRLSLLSAFFGAISSGFIAQATVLCSGCSYAGIFAGGIWAFSHLTWKFSTHFEVFSLNNLFCSILTYLTVSFSIIIPFGIVIRIRTQPRLTRSSRVGASISPTRNLKKLRCHQNQTPSCCSHFPQFRCRCPANHDQQTQSLGSCRRIGCCTTKAAMQGRRWRR